MNYPLKLIKTAWFGVKNNRTAAGFVTLLCVLIMPAFSIVFNGMNSEANVGLFSGIAAYFCGILLPTAMFGYLHSGRECDFYSAMPVKKSQYFWGYFIAGLLIFLVPVTVMFAVYSAAGTHAWERYFQSAETFFVLYCSTVLAAVFSGSTSSTLVTLIIRNGSPIALAALPLMIANVDVNAYVELLFKPICILTPATAGNAILFTSTDGVLPFQMIIAALELITAFFLHRYRRNEATTALAFPKSRYFYQYTVMLIFTLGADAVMLPLFDIYSYQGIYTGSEMFPMAVFLTAVVIFISFILMNIVLERNSRAAFKRIRHFFIFTAGYGLLMLSISGIAARLIPPSVLPFSPDSAVIWVYSVQEAESDESLSFGEDFDFTYFSCDGENGDFRVHYYKEIFEEAFAVTEPEKINELVRYAMYTSNNMYENGYFGILNQNYKYPFDINSANGYTIYPDKLPEDFTIFWVSFRQSDDYRGEDAVYNYSRSTARYGFSAGTERITAYKDLDLDVQRNFDGFPITVE